MGVLPLQLNFIWLAGCRSHEASPCEALTDRRFKEHGGTVLNVGTTPFFVISSDFLAFDRVRFSLHPGSHSRLDLCVSDMDAIPFSKGIRVWVDGARDDSLSRQGPGVFRIRDGYDILAQMKSGVLIVYYKAHPVQEFFGGGPQVLSLEEARSGDLQLHSDQAILISLGQ